jgi:hypothetical protein
MAQAKKVSDIEGRAVAKTKGKAKQRRWRQRKQALKGKTFEELTAEEKDLLLKAWGVESGLIKDSDDA